MTDKEEHLDKPQHKPSLSRTADEALSSDKETVVLREAVEGVGKAGARVHLDAAEAGKLRKAGKARRLRLDDLPEAE